MLSSPMLLLSLNGSIWWNKSMTVCIQRHTLLLRHIFLSELPLVRTLEASKDLEKWMLTALYSSQSATVRPTQSWMRNREGDEWSQIRVDMVRESNYPVPCRSTHRRRRSWWIIYTCLHKSRILEGSCYTSCGCWQLASDLFSLGLYGFLAYLD